MDFWVRVTDSSGEVINSQSEFVDVTETPPGGVFSAFSNASSQTFNHTVYIDVGVASSISNLHNWEGCYVSWQTIRGKPPLVPVLDSREIVLLEDPLIIARYFVFVDPKNITQVTLYWFEEALFNTGTTVQRKYVRISLIIRTTDQSNIRQQEDQLLAIGNSIATYWGPLKQQSLITIGIPILQYLLVGFIGMTITIGVIQHTTNQRVKQNNLKVFDSFATNREKLVLQTIRMFKRDTPPPESMLKSIQNTINETAKDDISSEKLRDILNNLETHNLIRKAIVTIQNQPWLVWKF